MLPLKAMLFCLSLPFILPGQNSPCTAIPLPNNMPDFQTYSTAGLSNSGLANPNCGASVSVDIWFQVVAPPSGDMDIATLAGTMGNAAMAIYAGPCINPQIIACTEDDNCVNTIMPVMQFDQLTPGQTYYIRIWPEGGGGSFEIRITDGDPAAPPFILNTVGSASQAGINCVQLTPNANTQVGCAWNPQLVNFSQPFTHSYLFNFGNNNGGADGISLVYHNDPSGAGTCGQLGGGLGVIGIQNSFIVEFDTWDNGAPNGDIPADHFAVNLNGSLAAPIAGPIGLPNIEDGQDHQVTFSWNPATNQYTVTFDNVLFYTGTYDIIGNVFGGTTQVYCGFAASTGAASNTQTVCSVGPEIYPAGSETFVEAEICQGEFYIAGGGIQTTSGTYFDFFPSFNGCDSTIITELTVLPTSLTMLTETICAGDCITINGNDYCNTGFFNETLPNYLGCDSLVTLNLVVLNPIAQALPPEPLSCQATVTLLDASPSTTGPGMMYQWSGPSPDCFLGSTTSPQVFVDCPGTYTLTISHQVGGLTCTSTTTLTVTENIEAITAQVAPPSPLDCNNACTTLNPTGSTQGINYQYSWTGPNNYSSNLNNPSVCDTGTYTLQIMNPNNGCSAFTTVQVVGDLGIPVANAGPDNTLNCAQSSLDLVGTNTGGGTSINYQWLDQNGASLSFDSLLNVQTAATYILALTNPDNGCTDLDTITILADFVPPLADAGPNQQLDCNTSQVALDGSGSTINPNTQYQWVAPDGQALGTTLGQNVSAPGTYELIVTNPDNGCQDTAQVQVLADQNAPIAQIDGDNFLNCAVSAIMLDGSNSTSGNNIVYAWVDENATPLGSSTGLTIQSPGTYTLILENTDNNCVDSAQIVVQLDTLAPLLQLSPDTLLTCLVPNVQIGDPLTSPNPNWVYQWLDENGVPVGSTPEIEVSQSGLYELTILDTLNLCQVEGAVFVDADNVPPIADPGPDGLLTCNQADYLLQATDDPMNTDLVFTWEDGQGAIIGSDPDLLVTNPDTYWLTVEDLSSGCLDSAQVVVNQDINPPMAEAGPDALINCHTPDWPVEGSTDAMNVQVQWTDANQILISNTNLWTATIAGTYYFAVTNLANGCSNLDSITISADFAAPQADGGPDLTLDCLAQSALLDGQNSSAGPNISYHWENANGIVLSTQPTLSTEEANTYYLEVLNTDNGCFSVDTVLVEQDADAPLANAGPNGLLTCQISSFTLDGSNSTAGPNIELAWQDSQGNILGQNEQLTVSESGLYTLTVLNLDNGCTALSNVEVALDTLAPVADVGALDTLDCLVSTLTLEGLNTSLGPEFLYSWTDEQGNLLATTPDLLVDSPGNYSLVIVDQTNGCLDSNAIFIPQDTLSPLAEAGNDLLLNCLLPTEVLSAQNVPTEPWFTLTWTDELGTVLGTTPDLPIDQAGIYELELVNTLTGCVGTDEVVVNTDFTPPLVDAGPDQLINCYQGITILDGSNSASGPDFTYQWTDENNQPLSMASSFSVAAAGQFILEITNTDNGCVSLDTVFVAADFAEPLVEAGPDQLLNCFMPQGQLDGSNSSQGSVFDWQWTAANGNVLGTNTIEPIDEPGIYYLSILNTQNGCSAQDSVLVTADLEAPMADAGADGLISCEEPSVSIDGSGSSSGPIYAYTWTDEQGNLLSTLPAFSTTEAGLFNLLVTNTQNGCLASDQMEVVLDQEFPVASLTVNEVLTCINLEAILDPSGSSTGFNYQYEWNTLSGGPIGIGADDLFVTAPGTYELIVLNLDNGCADTATVQVSQDIAVPVAEAGPAFHLNCFQTTVELDATASQPVGALSYSWASQNGSILTGSNSAQPSVNTAATYTLEVTNTQNGCTALDSVLVTASFLEALELEATPPPCFGQTGSVAISTVSGGVAPYLYSVNNGSFGSTTSFNNLPAGNYEVIVQDADGCELSASVQVVDPAAITLSLPELEIVSLGESYELDLLVNRPPDQIASVVWSPGTYLDCVDCLTPIATPLSEIGYSVVVTDINGCAASLTTTLQVDARPAVYIPNIFSPDNDGINDIFFIQSASGQIAQVNSFLIFNRWGESVASFYDFAPNDPAYGWDGWFRGKELDPGVFVYWAEIELINGETKLYKGDVTLVR